MRRGRAEVLGAEACGVMPCIKIAVPAGPVASSARSASMASTMGAQSTKAPSTTKA